MRNYFVPGEWNAVCQRCSFSFKASQLQLEWTGFRVCADCFETRHPQTLLQVPNDSPDVPWTSDEPDDVFKVVPYIAPTVGKQT